MVALIDRRSVAASLLACLALVAVVATLFVAPAQAGKQKGTYAPPYKNGPQGGDDFNHVYRDADSGTMGVLRIYPGVPPVVGCAPEPSAGWSMFRVTHTVTRPVSTVTIVFDGMLDPYTWVTGGVRDGRGEWLGVAKLQGPHSGAGRLKVKLFDRPQRGERVTVEFGLQLGDACPQLGGGTAEFSSVKVGT
ncbi:MAG: hypothetical protein ACRDKZ_13765 [Actinomycetota bacterium]